MTMPRRSIEDRSSWTGAPAPSISILTTPSLAATSAAPMDRRQLPGWSGREPDGCQPLSGQRRRRRQTGILSDQHGDQRVVEVDIGAGRRADVQQVVARARRSPRCVEHRPDRSVPGARCRSAPPSPRSPLGAARPSVRWFPAAVGPAPGEPTPPGTARGSSSWR